MGSFTVLAHASHTLAQVQTGVEYAMFLKGKLCNDNDMEQRLLQDLADRLEAVACILKKAGGAPNGQGVRVHAPRKVDRRTSQGRG